MGLTWARNQRLNQAFLVSIAIHLVIALLIPTLVVLNGDSSSIETISFAQIIRVHIATPRPMAHTVRALAPAVAPVVQVSRNRAAAPTAKRATTAPINAGSMVSRAPVTNANTREGGATTQAGTGQPAVAASPQAEASSESPRHEPGGYMPLGAEQPVPVLDPTVRQQLVALDVHVKLTITVDDAGHTKSVAFDPELDALTESRIRAMLASATWDPATCGGGIPCEANATITL